MFAGHNDLVSPKGHVNAEFQVFALSGGNGRVRPYKKRRAHTKTNSGCLTCREKRVKCDELRPVCVRCHRNDRTCVYGPRKIARPRPDKLSILSTVTVVPFSAPTAHNGTPSIHLIQHMTTHWFEIFNFPCTDEALTLFKSHPLVRKTALAVSACHLRNMSPEVLQHRIAEHFQQSLALQDYQNFMSMPPTKLGQSGVNAMMFSAVLLNILAFALPMSKVPNRRELDPSSSWVFEPHEDSLGWLVLQEGLRHLLKSTAAFLGPAMKFLGQIFLHPGDDPWSYSALPLHLGGVPRDWVRLFRLDDDNSNGARGSRETRTESNQQTKEAKSDPQSSIFRPLVLVLTRSLKNRSAEFNVFHNFTFLSKVHTEFRALLYLRDERALWLFGYWLGLMSHHEGLWWCEKRVKRDYQAIRMWLEQACVTKRPGEEGELWREMMVEFDNVAIVPR